jgi:phosphotransacetylase
VQNAARLVGLLGVKQPKAALLAAVEAIYPAIPVTMEEAAIAKMSDRGQIKGCFIDGPLSFDVAISTEVAHSKGIVDSRVAGDTDIFVGPSMETAHGMYKAMVLYAGVEMAGVIFGGVVPVATSFIVDPIESIINSIVLGAYVSLE